METRLPILASCSRSIGSPFLVCAAEKDRAARLVDNYVDGSIVFFRFWFRKMVFFSWALTLAPTGIAGICGRWVGRNIKGGNSQYRSFLTVLLGTTILVGAAASIELCGVLKLWISEPHLERVGWAIFVALNCVTTIIAHRSASDTRVIQPPGLPRKSRWLNRRTRRR